MAWFVEYDPRPLVIPALPVAGALFVYTQYGLVAAVVVAAVLFAITAWIGWRLLDSSL